MSLSENTHLGRRRCVGGYMIPALLASVLFLLMGGEAMAQCSMDTECKGDRICEDGKCVFPDAAELSRVEIDGMHAAVQAFDRGEAADFSPAPAAGSAEPEAAAESDASESEGVSEVVSESEQAAAPVAPYAPAESETSVQQLDPAETQDPSAAADAEAPAEAGYPDFYSSASSAAPDSAPEQQASEAENYDYTSPPPPPPYHHHHPPSDTPSGNYAAPPPEVQGGYQGYQNGYPGDYHGAYGDSQGGYQSGYGSGYGSGYAAGYHAGFQGGSPRDGRSHRQTYQEDSYSQNGGSRGGYDYYDDDEAACGQGGCQGGYYYQPQHRSKHRRSKHRRGGFQREYQQESQFGYQNGYQHGYQNGYQYGQYSHQFQPYPYHQLQPYQLREPVVSSPYRRPLSKGWAIPGGVMGLLWGCGSLGLAAIADELRDETSGFYFGVAATAVVGLWTPLIARAGRSARNGDPRVPGVMGLRSLGWVSYGVSMAGAGILIFLAGIDAGVPSEGVIMTAGLIGFTGMVFMSIDALVSGVQAGRAMRQDRARFMGYPAYPTMANAGQPSGRESKFEWSVTAIPVMRDNKVTGAGLGMVGVF